MSNGQTKTEYLYHVAYNFAADNGLSGFGDITLDLANPIDSGPAIAAVSNYIRDRHRFHKVVVLNFQLLSGPVNR
ncbi:hypothetical protein [Phytomonospora endophytica]|uniref:Uncharacterized protein n=1 Tax=Phytomonospora endophytica TaxID=714109 RepID=A0A841G254_9ACTN|nr:hypothetical protein [Phytomonospora endophytica]MBB6038230.1 hypothetical protein [Phytomonospora endophytica]GIG67311.1 hypothetical protein Pen01_36060 [Phytomonospora endophytica]